MTIMRCADDPARDPSAADGTRLMAMAIYSSALDRKLSHMNVGNRPKTDILLSKNILSLLELDGSVLPLLPKVMH